MYENIPFIDKIIHRIVSIAVPDKIILFGSYARGDNRKDSDVDILILKKGLKNERELTSRLYMDFFDNKISTPVDLIAIDYDRYNELNDDIGYIYKTIKKEGQTLYEYL
jgi:predicted nucleotidyltransferase